MQMAKCPKCGADNSVKREGCFNCGTALRSDASPAEEFVSKDPNPVVYPGLQSGPAPVPVPRTNFPYLSVLIGFVFGLISALIGLVLLFSPDPRLKTWGRGMLFGAAACLIFFTGLGFFSGWFAPSIPSSVPTADLGPAASRSSSSDLFDKIQMGMTAEQVVEVCGEPSKKQVQDISGRQIGDISVPGQHIEYWYWNGISLQVVLENGLVTAKNLY